MGRQIASVSPLGFRTTQIFDAAGQLSASQDALGYRTSYSYDPAGNRTVVQDANGKLTTTAYFSNRNLPEATIDAMGYRSTYAFDQQSRLVSTRDANGGYVTNIYDTVGRLAVVQNQLGESARQYGYDLAGRIVTMADAANRVRSYTFDAAGQNTATMFPDGKIATFAFDKVGKRTTMVDWGGTSTYSFDALSRQSGQTDAAGFVQAYTHDETGNRTGLNLVGTGRFTFTFDSLNRLATAQKPGDQRYTLSYDADSRRTTMMLGNGTTRKYAFDARSQLTTQIELDASSQPICTIVDGYDPVGNRLTRNLDGNLATWSYDDLYRLTGQLKAGHVCTYSLDGVGNLKTMWEGGSFPKTFAFDAADRLSTMTEGANLTTYAWTKFGSMDTEITGIKRTTYSYSGQDQLIGLVDAGGNRSTYSFNGHGLRRTAQEGSAQPTTIVWDGSDYLLLRGPSSDQVVLTLEGEIVACGSYDLLPDSLGSVIGYTQAGSNPVSLYGYWPYGRVAVPLIGGVPFPFMYVGSLGYYYDTGDRDYVRARELYKAIGRWMQLDPLWPEGRSLMYCDGTPITYIDPGGAQKRKPQHGQSGGVVAPPPHTEPPSCFPKEPPAPGRGAPPPVRGLPIAGSVATGVACLAGIVILNLWWQGEDEKRRERQEEYCDELNRRYKRLCGDFRLWKPCTYEMSCTEIQALTQKYKMCMVKRQEFKRQCVQPLLWDPGHEYPINLARQLYQDCLEILRNICGG